MKKSPRVFWKILFFGTILATSSGFFAVSADYALAQNKVSPFNPVNQLRDVAGAFTGSVYDPATGQYKQARQPRDLRTTIFALVRILLGLIGTFFFLMILYAGFKWFSAGGNTDAVDTAKSTLRNAIIGMIIVVSSYAILTFIFNNVILNRVPFGEPDPTSEGQENQLTIPALN